MLLFNLNFSGHYGVVVETATLQCVGSLFFERKPTPRGALLAE